MDSNNDDYKPVFTWCCTDLNKFNNSRRCFMTGEYCSKQDIIQKERQQLRGGGGFVQCNQLSESPAQDNDRSDRSINAFVIMSFSSVSDVIFKWRINDIVEKVREHLYFSKKNVEGEYDRLYCLSRKLKDVSEEATKKILEDEHRNGVDGSNLREILVPVKKINVIRADSSPSTNFVMCNRVCQQIQIADLVIVDVSMVNANVFYELGMAVALGKMILPICYSETYYRMELPEKIQMMQEDARRYFEHHIGCFPWRRELFEHFGIRYRNHVETSYAEQIKKLRNDNKLFITDCAEDDWSTQYLRYEDVIREQYGFDEDRKYAMIPYLNKVEDIKGFEHIPTIEGKTKDHIIGECIYKKLQASYNLATGHENTLVIYSMDGFLNEKQAAQCIVNYYNAIVRQFREQHCFCGERVGVLLQPTVVLEDPKDGKHFPPYNVEEIIHIGMNQATYRAHMETVKPDDFLREGTDFSEGLTCQTKERFNQWCNSFRHRTKGFIRNRCISIYPKSPVYVKRLTNGLQTDVFEDISLKSTNYPTEGEKMARLFFCYYHVMLRTLRYTNEIVVDIGENSLQAFFWLGAAHASDTSAIAVRHVKTDREKARQNESQNMERSIFDVSGLWTAVYRTDDAEGFFQQLYQAQAGIEQYSQLILKKRRIIEEDVLDCFWRPKVEQDKIQEFCRKKEVEEDETLEEYYRDRFWRAVLKRNRLHIYVRAQTDTRGGTETLSREPYVEKFDVEAVALLTRYLSCKKAISDYLVMPMDGSEPDGDALRVNFICIGQETGDIIKVESGGQCTEDETSTQVCSVLTYINSQIENCCEVCKRDEKSIELLSKTENCNSAVLLKGYRSTSETWMTQYPTLACYDCFKKPHSGKDTVDRTCKERENFVINKSSIENNRVDCMLVCAPNGIKCENSSYHMELAQLVLWREGSDQFRVTISGASGPATLALSSVLVNEEVKNCIIANPDSWRCDDGVEKELKRRRFPLSSLQGAIQEDLRKKYIDELRKRLESIVPCDTTDTEKASACRRYVERVLASVQIYISTVWYRYFFPFVTGEDIERICNGMKMFVSSMCAINASPFALRYLPNDGNPMGHRVVSVVAPAVSSVLRGVLDGLRGVEVFYEVDVLDNLDSRKRSIMGIVQSERIKIKCLYRKTTDEEQGCEVFIKQ